MDTWGFDYFRRGQAEYEKARCASVWNGLVPSRYPELICFPERDEHVRTIVLYAKAKGLTIGTKSGGHSWTASFLRDGGILVDLIKMNRFTFDAQARTAQAQPATYGSDLNASLVEHDLMFPGGHCPTVGLGGFLLQGGFGWNSRKWGLACENVLAIDVITADGELIHANLTQNPDFFWAARGSGCGYFGLITRFYLKLHSLPKGIMTARYVFELSDFDQTISEVDGISEQVPRDLEIGFFVAHDQDGFEGRPTLAITADALSDSEAEARAALELLHNLPSFKKTIKSYPFVSCTLKEMLKRFDDILDNRGRRYSVNNMWTDVPAQKLLPSFHEIVKNLPPAPSHLYMMWWLPPSESRRDMAFSLEARLYVAIYVITTDATTDDQHTEYVVDSMSLMNPHKKGIQLADENLPAHPGKFMKTSNYQRLEGMRKKYDADGRFYSYIRVTPEFERARASM